MFEKSYDITFGTRRLSEFDAKILSGITVSPIAPDTEVFTGYCRSTQHVLKNRRTANRPITMQIDFFGPMADAVRNESEFEGIFLGSEPVTIDIGDGFLYDSVLTSAKATRGIPDVCLSMEYTFSAVRTGMPIKIHVDHGYADDAFFCESTFPRTDCKIIVYGVSGFTEGTLVVTVNGMEFNFDKPLDGDLTIDGFRKMILDGDKNITNIAQWTDFPYLVPGNNSFDAFFAGFPGSIEIDLEYKPVYL